MCYFREIDCIVGVWGCAGALVVILTVNFLSEKFHSKFCKQFLNSGYTNGVYDISQLTCRHYFS